VSCSSSRPRGTGTGTVRAGDLGWDDSQSFTLGLLDEAVRNFLTGRMPLVRGEFPDQWPPEAGALAAPRADRKGQPALGTIEVGGPWFRRPS
jgi:hypothetical protein